MSRVLLAPGAKVRYRGGEFVVRDIVAEGTQVLIGSGRLEFHVDVVDLLLEMRDTLLEAPPSPLDQPEPPMWDIFCRVDARHQKRALLERAHLLEVHDGSRLDGDLSKAPRPQYDPARRTLHQRAEAKSKELRQMQKDLPDGWRCFGTSTIERRLKRLVEHGLSATALIDQRLLDNDLDDRLEPGAQEVLETTLRALARSSDLNIKATCEHVRKALHDAGLTVASDSQLTRAVKSGRARLGLDKLSHTRKSVGSRRDPGYRRVDASYAGQYVEIDEHHIDLLVVLPEVGVATMNLLAALDVYSRAVVGIVVTLGPVKSDEMGELLFEVLSPFAYPFNDIPKLDGAVLPVPDEIWVNDTVDRNALSKPAVFPQTLVTDNGAPMTAHNFRRLVEQLGSSFLLAAPGTPTGKAHIERVFNTFRDFMQLLPGYTGGRPASRGTQDAVERAAVLTPDLLADVTMRWFYERYNRTPHRGLPRHRTEARHMTPLERIRESSRTMGRLEMLHPQFSPYEFLPSFDCAVNADGFQLSNYKFNDKELTPLRGTRIVVHRHRSDHSKVYYFHHLMGCWRVLRGKPLTRGAKAPQTVGTLAAFAMAVSPAEPDAAPISDGDLARFATEAALSRRENRLRANSTLSVARAAKRTASTAPALEAGPPAGSDVAGQHSAVIDPTDDDWGRATW